MSEKYVYTCKKCGFDNSSGSKKCNSCGHNIGYTYNTYFRWACPNCRTLNMESNSTCSGCHNYQKKSSGGCYIATACYGSYEATEVLKFREFRDNYLSKKVFGRIFIKIYYSFSPKLAKKLENYPKVNSFIRVYFLDKIYNHLNK